MTWRDDVTSPAWIEAIAATNRTIAYRAEMVTLSEVAVASLAVDSASVEFTGESGEQWRASLNLSGADLVPIGPTSYLDGRSGLRCRLWWRILVGAAYMEQPVGTYYLEDPRVNDSGIAPKITVTGVDPLAVARRGKYGASVVNVGGMTVGAALTALFAIVAPGFPIEVADTTTTLPDVYDLWDKDPAEDWTDIAAMAGWVVRTNRLGVIVCGPAPAPSSVKADWQEGASCPVVDLDVDNRTSTIPRRVVVVSTNPDVTPVIVGEWLNPDADDQNIVTEQRVESGTVASQEAADNLARMTGERWARPQQSVEVTVPARPDLDYRDLISLGRVQANVSGTFRVSGWSMDLTGPNAGPALMRVRMMTRQADT